MQHQSARRLGPVQQTLVAWVSMLGSDILLHAGILHRQYLGGHPFLLTPERAFQLIPLGYASFLIVAVLLVWLSDRIGVTGAKAGAKFGLILGGAIWASTVAGLASITTAPLPLLAGWFVGQTLEIGVAGAVVGAARSGTGRGRIWAVVVGWCALALAITVVLQNTVAAADSAAMPAAPSGSAPPTPAGEWALTPLGAGDEELTVLPSALGDLRLALRTGATKCASA